MDDTTAFIAPRAAAWLALYAAVYLAAHRAFSAAAPARAWVTANLGKNETAELRVHDWASETVSTLHSAAQTVASFYLFWAREASPERYEALVRPWLVSLGTYMLFDTAVCLRHNAWLFRRTPGLAAHHAVVAASNFRALYQGPAFVYYQVVACLCEANSLFLHTRSAIRTVRPRLDAARFPNEAAVMLTFVGVRFPTSGYLVLQVLWLGLGTHPTLAVSAGDLAFWTFCALGLFGVNAVAFASLVSGYAREWSRRSSSSKRKPL